MISVILSDCLEETGFLQEVYALSALSVGFESPHIVRYYSGWIEDSNLYIVVRKISLTFTDGAMLRISQELFFKPKKTQLIL